MNDTRMTWVATCSPDPEKVIIILPDKIQTDVIETLKKYCKGTGKPKIIVQNESCTKGISPLSQSQRDKIDCDTVIYLLQSRESFRSIRGKMNLTGDITVSEYTVFPGWKNPRWFIPSHRSLAHGKMSRMIQPSRLVAKLAVTVFRFLKTLHVERYLFPCRLIVAHNGKKSFHNFFGALSSDINTGIVYTGSFGPLQKFTVELLEHTDSVFAYAKFGLLKQSKRAVKNEQIALTKLASLQLNKLQLPKLIQCNLPPKIQNKTIVVKTLNGGNQLTTLTDPIINGLIEISKLTIENNKKTLVSYANEQIINLYKIDCCCLGRTYEDMRNIIIKILEKITLTISKSVMLPLVLSHGDFTRWNVRADNDNIFVIDWEESAMRPPGHDIFTFLLTENLLVKFASPENVSSFFLKLYAEKSNQLVNKYFANIINNDIDHKFFFILFWAEVAHYNLWHAQEHKKHSFPEKTYFFDTIQTASISCKAFMELI